MNVSGWIEVGMRLLSLGVIVLCVLSVCLILVEWRYYQATKR